MFCGLVADTVVSSCSISDIAPSEKWALRSRCFCHRTYPTKESIPVAAITPIAKPAFAPPLRDDDDGDADGDDVDDDIDDDAKDVGPSLKVITQETSPLLDTEQSALAGQHPPGPLAQGRWSVAQLTGVMFGVAEVPVIVGTAGPTQPPVPWHVDPYAQQPEPSEPTPDADGQRNEPVGQSRGQQALWVVIVPDDVVVVVHKYPLLLQMSDMHAFVSLQHPTLESVWMKQY
ncbi:hypothetical protein HOO65_050568 [Ceratocystis lukuohia]|uniref:Uncharacterized protein n=1 Tax=Ceratocystis lukuohia TaxID=2019550 RepID=A0ABR4MGU4_9PEZI